MAKFKTYEQLCEARDCKKRWWGGQFHSMCLIAPTFPKGRTVLERRAIEFVLKRNPNAYKLHVYSVIQLVHDALREDLLAREKPRYEMPKKKTKTVRRYSRLRRRST